MEKKISFFPDLYEALKFLPDEVFGAVMKAAFEYQISGKEYSGEDSTIMLGFNFAKSQTDRAKEFSKKRADAASSRWETDANECKPMQTDANECKPMQANAPNPNPNPIPNPIKSESIAHTRKRKAVADRKSYGQYGWVKLNDDEYHRLLNDLGQAEVERCIRYIDESAQTTTNKNGWRDWNLTVRRCSREKWGLRTEKYQPSIKPGDIHGCTGPGQAELEAVRKLLAEEV